MEFKVLGPLAVSGPGGEVRIGGAKPRALLVRLLTDANRVVAADRLVEDLWEGSPPRSATATLQSHIAQLRRSLGSNRVETRSGGYAVVVADDELDARVFEQEVAEATTALRAGDVSRAADVLARALGRWRGPALADVAGAAWSLTGLGHPGPARCA